MKEQLESALRYLDDSSSITQACIEYGQKTNSTAAVVGLIRVRELIKHAILTNAMHSDGLYRCPTCNNKILKPGHCYNPHCPDRRR